MVLSINSLSEAARRLFLQLYLNCLVIQVPDGICTNTIYNILEHLQYQVRSIYLINGEEALIDVVPRDDTTIPLIKLKALRARNLLGQRVYCYINGVHGWVPYLVMMDFACALLYGICPIHATDMEFLRFNPRWRPSHSDHRFCLQGTGPRSV